MLLCMLCKAEAEFMSLGCSCCLYAIVSNIVPQLTGITLISIHQKPSSILTPYSIMVSLLHNEDVAAILSILTFLQRYIRGTEKKVIYE